MVKEGDVIKFTADVGEDDAIEIVGIFEDKFKEEGMGRRWNEVLNIKLSRVIWSSDKKAFDEKYPDEVPFDITRTWECIGKIKVLTKKQRLLYEV
jgi:hypothetical protein